MSSCYGTEGKTKYAKTSGDKVQNTAIPTELDSNRRDLEHVFVEEWIHVGGDSSEEQNTVDVPVQITIMAHDDESPAGQMNFTQNSIEAHHRRSLFGYKVRPKSRALSAGTQSDAPVTDGDNATYGYGTIREETAPARGSKQM